MATFPPAVAEVKRTNDTDVVIMGSGVLIRSLIISDLIDMYLLTVAPVVLGTDTRMFSDGVLTSLRLTDSLTASKGAIVATYETLREAS
jgi:dihydrofolate reductase